MKKNLKSILMLAALLTAGAAMTSCNNEDNFADEQPEGIKTYRLSIDAAKGNDALTRALSYEGTALNATWTTGDKVYVFNSAQKLLNGYLEAQSSGKTAALDGTLTSSTDLAVGGSLFFLYPSSISDYTGQDGTLSSISAKYDYAFGQAEIAEIVSESGSGPKSYTLKTVDVSGSGPVQFGNQQAIVKFTLYKADGTTSLKANSLTITAKGDLDDDMLVQTYTFGESVPATCGSIFIDRGASPSDNEVYAALGFCGMPGTKYTISLDAVEGTTHYTFEKAEVEMDNGKYYEINVKMAEAAPSLPAGALSGQFSVSGTKKVYFSQGNLQAVCNSADGDGSTQETWTWQFATHQWDYFGDEAANTSINGNGSVSAAGTVDHFCWSTNDTYYGIHNNNTSSFYTGNYVEWGTNIGDDWRTLTMDEWTWVLGPKSSPEPGANCRTSSTIGGTENARWLKATVHSVKGLIIFPDVFTWDATSMGDAPTTCNTQNDNFTHTLTNAQWTALESAGCVFLPTAGYRNGTTVNFFNAGYYWSSSTPTNSQYAYNVYISSDSTSPASSSYRRVGCAVRLVHDVK